MSHHDTTELDADVIVIGAGPVGTLLAADVLRGGASVLVVERDLEHADTIKAGSINLASAEILARRGLLEQARAVQTTVMEKAFAGQTGTGDPEALRDRMRRQTPRAVHFSAIMLDGDLLDHADPDVVQHSDAVDGTFIAQRDVQQILDEHAARCGVRVRRGVAVLGLQQHPDHVELQTDDGVLRAGWVVGCDGGRSVVRHACGFEFPGTDPEITGRQASVELADGDRDALAFGWHWSERGVYRYAPGGAVATVEFDGPPADRDRPVTLEEVQDSLRRVSGLDVTLAALRGNATRWTDNARQATTYRKGRVLLAGDAAHVHSPFSGQGLNLGLGDATNLGWKLAATVTGQAPEGLLDTYTTERHPLGAWVLDWTRAQVALMRPEVKTGQLREVVSDLLSTPDGLTRAANLISGVTQRVDIPGEHPLAGRLVPDITTQDGCPLREAFDTGRFVLLDRTSGAALAAAAAAWGDRVVVVADSSGGPAPAGLLARPDGVVAWACEPGAADPAELRRALSRWAGEPRQDSAPGADR